MKKTTLDELVELLEWHFDSVSDAEDGMRDILQAYQQYLQETHPQASNSIEALGRAADEMIGLQDLGS
jgi:hypothetical protein